MKNRFPELFKPLRVKDLILKNRIMSAPNMLFHTVDGRPDDYYTGYLEHKARGGAAIVNLGEVSVGDAVSYTHLWLFSSSRVTPWDKKSSTSTSS